MVEFEKILKKDFSVRCDLCFKKNCNCENKNLIELDKRMIGMLKTLNRKGYKTIFSCESHYGYSLNVYIVFTKNYFEGMEMPDGFKYNKKERSIKHIISSKNRRNREQFNLEKEYHIEKLKEWVKELKPIKTNKKS